MGRATLAPGEKTQEQESYKLRKDLVAVNRICYYFAPPIQVPLRKDNSQGAVLPPLQIQDESRFSF